MAFGHGHRWKDSLGPDRVAFFEEVRECLRQAWGWDKTDRDRYPVNTDYAVATIIDSLKGIVPRKVSRIPRPRRPRRFSDLAPERAIKAAYLDSNSGSYQEALRKASNAYSKEAWPTFQKLIRAVENAYLGWYLGPEFLPQPRVNFLHRSLLEIANLVEELRDLTAAGLAEFLDDLCPCGKKHSKEAVRKLRKRHRLGKKI